MVFILNRAVVEARTKPAGVAKVVETWGAPDAPRAVLAASLADRAVDPVSVRDLPLFLPAVIGQSMILTAFLASSLLLQVLAVARKNGVVSNAFAFGELKHSLSIFVLVVYCCGFCV